MKEKDGFLLYTITITPFKIRALMQENKKLRIIFQKLAFKAFANLKVFQMLRSPTAFLGKVMGSSYVDSLLGG